MNGAESSQTPDQVEILHGIQGSESPEMLVGASAQEDRLVAVGQLPPRGSKIGAPFDKTQRRAYLIERHAESASDSVGLAERAADFAGVAERQAGVGVEEQQHVTGRLFGAGGELAAAPRLALHDLRAMIAGELQRGIGAAAVGDDDLHARALTG